jgi:trimeric autotransporter adhesin
MTSVQSAVVLNNQGAFVDIYGRATNPTGTGGGYVPSVGGEPVPTGAVDVLAGDGIDITDDGEGTYTVENTGVLQVTAGYGISRSGTVANYTLDNTGVLQVTAGAGIGRSGTASNYTISNSGVIDLTAGNLITRSGTAANYTVAVTRGTPLSETDCMFIGESAGTGNDGLGCTALGKQALAGSCTITGSYSTCVGYRAGYNNSTGGYLTAFGTQALQNVVSGTQCTGVGYQAGTTISSGQDNTMVGYLANANASNAAGCTAIGSQANTATLGTAVGCEARALGVQSTALGYQAGLRLQPGTTTGEYTTAVGYQAGHDNNVAASEGIDVTFDYGTFVGNQAGKGATNFPSGTCVGYKAGYYGIGEFSTLIGREAGAGTGSDNAQSVNGTCVGYRAGMMGVAFAQTIVGCNAGNVQDAVSPAFGDGVVLVGGATRVATEDDEYGVAVGATAVCATEAVAVGKYAQANTIGCVSIGSMSGNITTASGTTSTKSTFVGFEAGYDNIGETHLDESTAIGYQANKRVSAFGINQCSYSTAVGYDAYAAASSTVVGHSADSVNFTGCTVLGRGATATANGQLVLGSAGFPLNTGSGARTGGAATALTGDPVGYLEFRLNGGGPFYLPYWS